MGYIAICIRCNYLVWAFRKKQLMRKIREHAKSHKCHFNIIKVTNDVVLEIESYAHDSVFWEIFNRRKKLDALAEYLRSLNLQI